MNIEDAAHQGLGHWERDRGQETAPAFCAALCVPESWVPASGSTGGDLAGKDKQSVQAGMETEEKEKTEW